MKRKGQISTDHQPAPRQPAQANELPALVREALTNRKPSPEAVAARDAWIEAQRLGKKIGKW